MNIVVCVKQVPSSNEQMLDPVTGTVIREGVSSILNPFDAHAVEEAVRLKARTGSGIVSALSMGVPSAMETLRRVVAVGVDIGYLLSDRAFAGADTLATANALSLGVRKIGPFDIIICGRMATDGDTAQVGPMMAEMLDVPHVTDVAAIEEPRINETTLSPLARESERGLILLRMTDDGYERVSVQLPALITVTKEINVPRLPSVTGVLRGRAANITVWNASDIGANTDEIGLRGSATRVVRTERPPKRAGCHMLSGIDEARDLLHAIQPIDRQTDR